MIDTNKIMLTASAMVLSISAQAFTVKGVVIDHSTKEPLIGATVQVGGTTTGVITDIDGRFEIRDIKGKSCTLVVQYVSYKTQKLIVQKGQKEELVIALSPDNQQLDEVTVVARKNLENERAPMMECGHREYRCPGNECQGYLQRGRGSQEDKRCVGSFGGTDYRARTGRSL